MALSEVVVPRSGATNFAWRPAVNAASEDRLAARLHDEAQGPELAVLANRSGDPGVAAEVGGGNQLVCFDAAGQRHGMSEGGGIGRAGAVRRGIPREAGVAGLVALVDIHLASEVARPHEASLARCEQ